MATETVADEVVELPASDDTVISTELHESAFEAELEIRSVEKREIGLKLLPWGVTRRSRAGYERFEPGAFAGIDPENVVLQLEHLDPPGGKGLRLEERSDGPYMVFKVSRTQRGDEILELARDKVTRGASVSYYDVPGGTVHVNEGGLHVRSVRKANLVAVSTTWRPTWEQSAVLYTRSREQEEAPVAEQQEAAAAATAAAPTAGYDLTPLVEELRAGRELQERNMDDLRDRLLRVTEQQRSEIIVPSAAPRRTASIGEWATVAFRMLIGERVSSKELQERSLEDIVTTENPGLVPDALLTSLIKGDINPGRPFLASTTQIEAPETGMTITVPVISQDVNAGVQSSEKGDVTSRALKVTTEDYPAKSIFGAADVSIQMLRRADRAFFSLFMRRLATAYARVADEQALTALFNSGTVSVGTGNIDPEDLTIGEAWENSMTATGEPPDTMWLSAEGVSAFINAKNDGSNSPLYFSLNAAFTVGGGPGGDVSALRPVYVPALDGFDVDVMIGPRSGFAWAEEAPIELTADVPSKAGRDIALGGIIFFLPLYPSAFTTYEIGS